MVSTRLHSSSVGPATPGRPITCRMFEVGWIERLSRIHPATPFLFWLPVLGLAAARAVQNGVGPVAMIGLALGGVLLWTLLEYLLHRFVFHWIGPRAWERRIHFIIHGVHHDFPSDPDRLVMPLGVSIPTGAALYLGLRASLGPVLVDPVFVGLGIGYLAYDGTHYAIHHFPMHSRWARWIKRHHLLHHHAAPRSRWGVSSPLWDWVFGTLRERTRG
jgi:sterol desaturase/sphingolipid hydroxylase (fatty acid hydroxylase superfamily)